MIFAALPEIKLAIRDALALEGEAARLQALSRLRLQIDPRSFRGVDPFTADYAAQVLHLYRDMTRREDYSPNACEVTNALDDLPGSAQPIPYRFGESALVGEYLSAYGWILKNLDVRAGDAVLEYGSGEGQLLVNLARIGCRAHAVDIEARFLQLVQQHAHAAGTEVRTFVGQFGDGFEGEQFDRIYFFEAFHHCFDHAEALRKIRHKLKDGGFIVFAGEPVLDCHSPDSSIVPYPWGLRLDGESVRSIVEFGWMELGFARDYFVELLIRSGFAVEFRPCPSSWRGDCYVARPFSEVFPLLSESLIEASGVDCGWHASEPGHRWTKGNACVPLPYGTRRASCQLSNLLDRAMEVRVSAGGEAKVVDIPPQAHANVTVEVANSARFLEIVSPVLVPAQAFPGSTDERELGVAVTEVSFEGNTCV